MSYFPEREGTLKPQTLYLANIASCNITDVQKKKISAEFWSLCQGHKSITLCSIYSREQIIIKKEINKSKLIKPSTVHTSEANILIINRHLFSVPVFFSPKNTKLQINPILRLSENNQKMNNKTWVVPIKTIHLQLGINRIVQSCNISCISKMSFI